MQKQGSDLLSTILGVFTITYGVTASVYHRKLCTKGSTETLHAGNNAFSVKLRVFVFLPSPLAILV